MDTFIKLSASNIDKSCNCVAPFNMSVFNGINPATGRNFTDDEKQSAQGTVYRAANANKCSVGSCCDPKGDYSKVDMNYFNSVKSLYPVYKPEMTGSRMTALLLSTTSDGKTAAQGWKPIAPYIVCKLSKAKIEDTADSNIKRASNIVADCFTDYCSNIEQLTLEKIVSGTDGKQAQTYTYFDDSRVVDAINDGNANYVKEYIRKYGTVDSPLTNDNTRNRMLHIACRKSENESNETTGAEKSAKRLEILNLLLALKPDINIKNSSGETPLMVAIKYNNFDAVEKLLSQGVDIKITNNKNETVMNYALKYSTLPMVRLLYNNGASISEVDKNGNNVLHYCIINCPVNDEKNKKMQYLLGLGANAEAKNNNGHTPLEVIKAKMDFAEIPAYFKTGRNLRDLAKNNYSDSLAGGRGNIEAFTNSNSNNNGNSKSVGNQKPTITMSSISSNSVGSNSAASKKNNTKPTQINFLNNSASDRVKFSNTNQDQSYVESQDDNYSKLSPNGKNLLELQTMIFNNIISNNPAKYNNYINVNEIPKGSPIEVIDTVCVGGTNINGNEDSTDCRMKGGKLVKIKNPTTRIKLEIIPNTEEDIENIDNDELYLPKYPRKINLILANMPEGIKKYNREYIESLPEDERDEILKTLKTNLEYSGFDTNGVDMLTLLSANEALNKGGDVNSINVTENGESGLYVDEEGNSHEFIYGEDGELIQLQGNIKQEPEPTPEPTITPISNAKIQKILKDEQDTNNIVLNYVKDNYIMMIILLILIILGLAVGYIYARGQA